jgi:hypothetical protein
VAPAAVATLKIVAVDDRVIRVKPCLTKPGEFLPRRVGSAYDAEKNFFQRQLLPGRRNAIVGSGGRLRFDSRAQLLERPLGNKPSLMNDGDVTAQALHDFEHM